MGNEVVFMEIFHSFVKFEYFSFAFLPTESHAIWFGARRMEETYGLAVKGGVGRRGVIY
jgi:hypothetical protein